MFKGETMFKAIPLFSGSSGNCVYVKYGDDEILIDAGVSFKNIRLALEKVGTDISNISAVFITHEHIDHIRALDVMSKHSDIPIYINQKSLDNSCICASSPFYSKAEIKNAGENIKVGGIYAHVFATPHDSKGSVGYRLNFDDGESFGYATDIGEITYEISANLLGCNSVVFESNHDVQMLKNGPYPYPLKMRILSDHGHLSNDACADFLPTLVDKGTSKIVLAHLSAENNTPEAAYRTSAQSLAEAGFTPDDVRLTVAQRSIL